MGSHVPGRVGRRAVQQGLAMAVAMAVSVGCMFFQPGPEAVAREWTQALASQDGLKLGELTCEAAQGSLQGMTAIYSMMGIMSGAAGGGAQTRMNVDDLKYETTRNDGT